MMCAHVPEERDHVFCVALPCSMASPVRKCEDARIHICLRKRSARVRSCLAPVYTAY